MISSAYRPFSTCFFSTPMLRDALYPLAQFNIAHMRYPRSSPPMISYQEGMDAVFPVALSWPGFIWTMDDDEIMSPAERCYGPNVAANISVWASLESLRSFMECPPHRVVMNRGTEWFAESEEPSYVFWWIDAGHRPSFDEAHHRLTMLRRLGPTENAFTLECPFHHPGNAP